MPKIHTIAPFNMITTCGLKYNKNITVIHNKPHPWEKERITCKRCLKSMEL